MDEDRPIREKRKRYVFKRLFCKDKPQKSQRKIRRDDRIEGENLKNSKEIELLKEEIEKLKKGLKSLQAQVSHLLSQAQQQEEKEQIEKQPEIKSDLPPSQLGEIIETIYVSRIDREGNIAIRNKLNRNDAVFELQVKDNQAELFPLPEQHLYLIMQKQVLIEPIFNVSGSGDSGLTVIAPAKYELRGDNLWRIAYKGEIEIN